MQVSSHNPISLGKLRMLIVSNKTDYILLLFFVKILYPEFLTSYRAPLLPATNRTISWKIPLLFSTFFIIKTI